MYHQSRRPATTAPVVHHPRRPSTASGTVIKPLGDPRILEHPTPQTSTKFAHVKSTLDTGKNANNVMPVIDRRHELYQRVTVDQLRAMLEAETADGQWMIVDSRESPVAEIIIHSLPFSLTQLHRDRWPAPIIANLSNRAFASLVIYDDSDSLSGIRSAHTLATEIVSKGRLGSVRVYVLTGGMRAMQQLHPEYVQRTSG